MSDEPSANRFWMVYSPSGRAPVYRHKSRESAEQEAKRLARENPQLSFFVLKAVTGFTAPEPTPYTIRIDPPLPPTDEPDF